MKTKNRRGRLAASAAMAALALSAAQASAQTATIAVGAPVTSIDPHYHQLSPNNAVADTIFDKLVNTDAQSRNIPGLATEWRAVEPTVWEFRLRPNVRFHNGNAFTAEDVAFTLQRLPNVPNSPSSFAVYSRPLTRIEIVDPLTIRLHTAQPYPLMPLDMTNVRIIDKETAENATTEDFNALRAAAGTGPYRAVTHRNGDRIEFERWDGYWGERAPFQRVNYRMITNDAARTAALLAGDVDLIDQVPTSDLAKLRQDNRVRLSETVGLRLIFLGLDFQRAATENSPFVTDNDGRPLGRNPLRDVRVRRALSMAIDRRAIVDRVMEGAAVPANQFLPQGVFGFVADLPAPAYDPDGARRLLAEAGYPNGFRIQLNGPNDRYINDSRIIQAIGQMWTRIGVRTAVEAQPWTTFIGRAGRQEYSAFLIGWGSNPDGSHPLRNIMATFNAERGWGASNRGRYSNPQVDDLLAQSLTELDEAKRERLVVDAMRIAMQDVGVVPLHIQTNIWASRRNFEHTARNDELTRAQDLRPAAR
ncbi:ABC transporter substrate-binding protein [Neoroseomonas oryzicola]|uniref:ABC transporter substrate-binding protein n=1 Tax=Neoroseomonas oryzicola TaxID=535904 RepID=A0A9X9WPY0_9PROT|nr:ABC transporter substrate-binding protein [Neoroseomonas oryzicola]MBR0662390.1 ABC transporter substrate-binding protein [Neoroseomonas oryzicola]NKE19926.1 ABC transporter substrate-binding protein [Neoroseomonas oryzicola]